MDGKGNGKKINRLQLTVNVRLQQTEDEKLPEIVAYAYDQNGQFLTSAPLPPGEHGEVKLNIPAELQGESVRVILGPPLMEESKEEKPGSLISMVRKDINRREMPSPAILIRHGAYEKRFRLASDNNMLVLDIYRHDWARWVLCPCVVHGRLIKRIELPDNTTQDLGVCSACVKIYEVDKFPRLIFRLPVKELYRLRDDLRVILDNGPIELPPRELPPEFGPKVWPPPPPPPPIRRFVKAPFTKISKNINAGPGAYDDEGPQPVPETIAFKAEAMTPKIAMRIETDLESVFAAVTVDQLRNALIANQDILVRYFCILDWLSYYFNTDLIKCVCTDEQGRFETTIWYTCSGDKPDLYFKAVQCIDCVLHTLYDPGVACHTHWNYECGSEVTLIVTDPAARVCVPPDPVDPPPGVTRWVMPYAVGGIKLFQIKTNGFTDYSGIVDAPFGSNLGFRHGYSSLFPINSPNQPFYYRWQYKKDGESEWHDFASPVASTVVRHYVDYDLSNPSKPPTFPAYTLGPKAKNSMHLYEFKPHNPPEPTGHNTEWPIDTWFADIYSGILKSTNLPGGVGTAHGEYKFKLDIYDPDGSRVSPSAATFKFIVPTGYDTDGVTVLTREANDDPLHPTLPVEIEDDGYVFNLHIDNRSCDAIIDAPTIGGVAADPNCGFLRYVPDAPTPVDIAFQALHPDNHATFHFQIRRSASPINTADGEVAAITAGDYAGDGSGSFDNGFLSGDLLGTCAEAAFAEYLRVWAKATNGWTRLDQYDAYDLRAFALAPHKPKTSETA